MKIQPKILPALLAFCLLLPLCGCGQAALPDKEEQLVGICPYAIRVDGQVYICHDAVPEPENFEPLGKITSTVKANQWPEIDDQANFGYVGDIYGTADGRVYFFSRDTWYQCDSALDYESLP